MQIRNISTPARDLTSFLSYVWFDRDESRLTICVPSSYTDSLRTGLGITGQLLSGFGLWVVGISHDIPELIHTEHLSRHEPATTGGAALPKWEDLPTVYTGQEVAGLLLGGFGLWAVGIGHSIAELVLTNYRPRLHSIATEGATLPKRGDLPTRVDTA